MGRSRADGMREAHCGIPIRAFFPFSSLDTFRLAELAIESRRSARVLLLSKNRLCVRSGRVRRGRIGSRWASRLDSKLSTSSRYADGEGSSHLHRGAHAGRTVPFSRYALWTADD